MSRTARSRARATTAWVARALLVVYAAAAGQVVAVDLHRLWDDRCAPCHQHSGDFARAHLTVEGEIVTGAHPDRDLRLFLRNHYATESEVDALYDMLRAQAELPARFRSECGACHESAAVLVRESLMLRDGELFGRESGAELGAFLGTHPHGGIDDPTFFTELLGRVAREVYRP